MEKAEFKEKYDLVMTFESIHNMRYPIEALQRMRGVVVSPEGAILIGDVGMKEKLEEKMTLRVNYTIILVCCFVFHNQCITKIL